MNDEETTPSGRRWGWLVAAAALLAGLAAAALWWGSREGTPAGMPDALTFEARAPEGVRVRVEILNATATRGLALAATGLLRDRGFDVVSIGNAPARRDSTLVLDRTVHPHWARLVSEVLGGSAVESRPDSSRYVDITVLLGANWTPPAKTIYP